MPTKARIERKSIKKSSPATVPGRKWRARVKLDGIEYFLGNFDTYKEAKETEDDFRKFYKEV